MNTLLYSHLGNMDYSTALGLQERLLERKQREEFPDILLVVEHPHVFTIGRSGRDAHVIAPGDVPVYRTSRGGDVTYHGPGQLVAYPIIDLRSKLRKAVHRHLNSIELTITQTVASFGLSAERKPPWTGIWIGNKKLASIGVAVKRGVTYHGLALNVNTDLDYFTRIVPCGLGWAEMTSMARELGTEIPLARVREEFLRGFAQRFGYAELKEVCLEGIQTGSKSDFPEAPTIFISSTS
ncbi:MAG: lipoyl(octanoyl) transferase LipB [Deltaproteobacteria bacterium]|nr:lipoyl(octanoyl) transferase LipB [Deltaproteobacteria bacterium]